MSKVDYDWAVRVWIGRQENFDPEDISNVEFRTIQEGYCETCEYTTMGLVFDLDNVGKYPYTRRRGNQITMEYIPPADFIREVSEIIAEESEGRSDEIYLA